MTTTKRSSAVDSKVQQKQIQSETEETVAGLDDGGQSLDKVRDILFGQNMRTYEDRLQLLEQRMLDEVRQLRETAEGKFQQLESLFRKELSALGDHLKSEKDERNADVQGLRNDMKSAADSLEHRLSELHSRVTESGDGLSDQIRVQAKTLTEDLHRTSSEITTRLDRELHEVRDAKSDTATLAALFAELADRLRDHSPSSD